MGTIHICDICGRPLRGGYRDENDKWWDDVSFQAKRYRTKVCFAFDSWTQYLSICGYCRHALYELKFLEEEAEWEKMQKVE